MNLRYLKILLIGLALVFLSQGCLPPPPFYFDHDRHYHHHRYRYGYSSQQSPKPVAQLIIQNGGEFSDRGEVAR
jgi:hypothetical protein